MCPAGGKYDDILAVVVVWLLADLTVCRCCFCRSRFSHDDRRTCFTLPWQINICARAPRRAMPFTKSNEMCQPHIFSTNSKNLEIRLKKWKFFKNTSTLIAYYCLVCVCVCVRSCFAAGAVRLSQCKFNTWFSDIPGYAAESSNCIRMDFVNDLY